jgi:hypothetical protein
MSSFPILDLVIGMIFIFFLLSIICSSAVELWFSLLQTRSKVLAEWLKKIFDSKALDSHGNVTEETVGQAIMDHCMVRALSKTNKSPSYISAENFVSALLDKITIKPNSAGGVPPVQLPPKTLAEYITAIENSTVISGELKRTVLSFAHQARASANALESIPEVKNINANISIIKSDLDEFRRRLAHWYDTNSERLTGAFKRRKALPATFVFGLLLTVGVNADSVAISKYLYNHPDVSKKFADQALTEFQTKKDRVEAIKAQMDDTTRQKEVDVARLQKEKDTLVKDISNLATVIPQELPMGWQSESYDWKHEKLASTWGVIVNHGVGWLATVLAICMGAPFWFDILNKISNLRSTGPKPTSSTDDDQRT